MESFIHDHDDSDEFEAGCPRCESDEVSLQDVGRCWGASLIKHPTHAKTRKHFAENPLPQQRQDGAA